MAGEPLSDELRSFLRENVHSYEELEILLLLTQRREGRWSVDSVAAELRLPEAMVSAALTTLHARGLVQCTNEPPRKFWYDSAAVTCDPVLTSLAAAYTTRRFAVVEVMSANALSRLRSSALRTFAEAFRIRGPKKNG